MQIDYDIWLVNGDPQRKNFNPFEHQFSFEMHDIVEIYLTFFILYSFLVPIQMYAFRKQDHVIPKLLTTSIMLEYMGILCSCIHYIKFAFDGRGVEALRVFGNLMNTLAPTLFMALIVLIAKGWTITVKELGAVYRKVIMVFWTVFIVGQVALFVWKMVSTCHVITVRSFITFCSISTSLAAFHLPRLDLILFCPPNLDHYKVHSFGFRYFFLVRPPDLHRFLVHPPKLDL